MRRRIGRITTGGAAAWAILAAIVAFVVATWVGDDGVSEPAAFRVRDGAGGTTYFVLLGAGRMTLVKQDVTQPPDGSWTTHANGLGDVTVIAGGERVALVASRPQWRGRPQEWGRFHLSGPKVLFVAQPPLRGPQVCAVNYSGLSLPLWAVALPAAIPPGAWLLWRSLKERKRSARERHGLCVACGYDLRGSPGQCPECGSDSNLDATRVTTS